MNWYAIYTKSRAEKKVHEALSITGIESYLPLQKTLKIWSDRKKWVTEPMFHSYVFVHISQKEYYDVLNTPGVVRYITFEGKAVTVPLQQIEAIKNYEQDIDTPGIENINEFEEGKSVQVLKGPMKGLEGVLVNFTGKSKVRIKIESINQYVLVNISVSHLRILNK